MSDIKILNMDVINGLRSLPDRSVHCVITSPPYWGLRDYGVEGQIGLEPSPKEYLDKMVEIFQEVRRVLRDDGTLWLNLGDSYANAQPRGRMEDQGDLSTGDHGELIPKRDWSAWSLKQKDLVGMCWRVAFALQSDGWYLRSDIVWAKPNPMPESVTDRPTRSHEYVFLLTKNARYFYDADAARESQTGNAHSRGNGITPKTVMKNGGLIKANESFHRSTAQYIDVPGGRNRRDVWIIPTQPTPEAHFATFPEALVEPCIKAGTSERGCCSVCGSQWVREVDEEPYTPGKIEPREFAIKSGGNNGKHSPPREKQLIGWQPSCACSNEDPIPCTVLDPFGGSGTVAKVARDLNRNAILIEINPAYVEIAKRKLRAHEQLFNKIEVVV